MLRVSEPFCTLFILVFLCQHMAQSCIQGRCHFREGKLRQRNPANQTSRRRRERRNFLLTLEALAGKGGHPESCFGLPSFLSRGVWSKVAYHSFMDTFILFDIVWCIMAQISRPRTPMKPEWDLVYQHWWKKHTVSPCRPESLSLRPTETDKVLVKGFNWSYQSKEIM